MYEIIKREDNKQKWTHTAVEMFVLKRWEQNQ